MLKNKGFTLIELLVVIAIIGILASIILVNLGNTRKQAREASAMASMSSIRSAAEVYFSTNGNYGTVQTTCAGPLFTNTDIAKLIAAVTNQVGAPTCNVSTNGDAWAVAVALTSGNYCVDSTGTSDKRSTALGSATECPAT